MSAYYDTNLLHGCKVINLRTLKAEELRGTVTWFWDPEFTPSNIASWIRVEPTDPAKLSEEDWEALRLMRIAGLEELWKRLA